MYYQHQFLPTREIPRMFKDTIELVAQECDKIEINPYQEGFEDKIEITFSNTRHTDTHHPEVLVKISLLLSHARLVASSINRALTFIDDERKC